MSKMKKVLLMCIAYVLVAALAIGGTLAYLQDEDTDVNVMTLGNVSIEQIEQQENEAGELVPFEQAKEFYPGTGISKIVTVKNTGKSDAYFRTLIAFEDLPNSETFGINFGFTDVAYTIVPWGGEPVAIEIDGVDYVVYEFIHKTVLTAGAASKPSLYKVEMATTATNEDMKALGDTYDILVLSQAIQSEGFENAQAALDIGFGDVTAENAAKWFDGVIADYEANLPDTWDSTSNISWYLENPNAEVYTLNSAEDLAGLATLVDGTAVIPTDVSDEITLPVTFEGKTILLNKNVDLYAEDANGEAISFDPIGSYVYNKTFNGVFDGQGHTISNMYQNGWALANGYWDGDDYGLGLFASLKDATVKNVKLDGVNQPTEANIIGTVAGIAVGDCVFENISVTNSYMGNHSWYSGGIVGWAKGNQKFINCDINANSSISSQWGDFNNANGGLIGGVDPNGTYYIEDCDIACVIDAYNDVTSAYEWYSYRNCGMIVGDTGSTKEINGTMYADASHIICKDVTVTYGKWANYHYCEFGSAGYPFCRVEAGETTGAYGNARVGEYTDANGNKVVDDNHVHNAGEKHNELIEFNQLFGGPGGDRYCTYGTATHDGVTVTYNN